MIDNTLEKVLCSDNTDTLDLIRNGVPEYDYVPEQERNFAAGVMPERRSGFTCMKEEWIDGKLYKVWS